MTLFVHTTLWFRSECPLLPGPPIKSGTSRINKQNAARTESMVGPLLVPSHEGRGHFLIHSAPSTPE
jgi:hypothetical protein